jgi:putative cardiolipin synthase
MMEHLISQSVAIREHMPDVRYKVELGRQRMHDKLMIVDGKQLIIGGRNVRADYYGMSCQPEQKNRWDRDVFVIGPIAETVRCYFLQRWSASTSGQPTLTRDEKKKTEKAQVLSELNDMPRPQALACASRLLDEALIAPLPYSNLCCQHHGPDCDCEEFFDLACVNFLHDIPEHPKDCPSAIAGQLNNALRASQSSVLFCTPYPVFTKDLREILTDASSRGVQICLLTNSLSTTDRTITHAQYANERRWMLSAGIQLWEMQGERMLHAKSMVIDCCRSMIGSYNFDVLSETRNSETALLINDAAFAGALTAQIGRHLLEANPVEGPLHGFDARTNDVEDSKLRRMRRQRLISPWIKQYL